MSDTVLVGIIFGGYLYGLALTVTIHMALAKWEIVPEIETGENGEAEAFLLWPLIWIIGPIVIGIQCIGNMIERERETPTISQLRKMEGDDG
jgi:ethanolamine transporter EutH